MPKIYFINTKPRVRRRRRRKLYFSKPASLFLKKASRIFTILLVMLLLLQGAFSIPKADGRIMEKGFFLVASLTNDYRNVLQLGLPQLMNVPEDHAMIENILLEGFQTATQLQVKDPRSILNAQLPLIGAVEQTSLEAVQASEVNPIDLEQDYTSLDLEPENVPAGSVGKEETVVSLAMDKPLVAIYNTHNAETYLPDEGSERVEGKNGGVVDVAAVLAKTLEERYGVKTIRSDQIHDYPSYERSYGNSLKTAEGLLKVNPSVQMVFDIHRDAGIPAAETVEIQGKPAARILIIVGNLVRWEGQPKGEGNMEFAKRLNNKLDDLYPGLVKGIRVKSGRYNQHLHPHALLLEFGSSRNSQAQAEYTAQLMAKGIAELLQEMRQESTL